MSDADKAEEADPVEADPTEATVSEAEDTGYEGRKPTLKERLQEHLREYGKIALATYFLIALTTYIGFFVAIKAGIDVGDSATGSTGTFFAAWVAYKLTQPLRIGATFVATPIVAAVLHRIRPSSKAPADAAQKD